MTLDDLLPIAFPDVDHFEHKHVSSALRAADSVAHELGWDKRKGRGRKVIYRPPHVIKADAAARAAFMRAAGEADDA